MMTKRIINHPILGKVREKRIITFTYDNQEYKGLEGDAIATALLANNIRTLRVDEASERPRGIYCNIGHCFECRVTVNEEKGIRACLTPIENNMIIESGKPQAQPFKNKQPKTYTEFEKNEQNDAGDLDV